MYATKAVVDSLIACLEVFSHFQAPLLDLKRLSQPEGPYHNVELPPKKP